MKLGAKAAPAPAEPPTDSAPAEEPTDDLDFSTDDAGTEPPTDDTAQDSGSGDKPFDDEPFDAGVEADEESDPKKFIEQLTGKLGQSLRKYNEDQGEPDFELEKFAVNSLLSATHTGEMDAKDQKDIIKKVKSSGKGDGDEESTDDTETDDTDTETTDTETTDTETTDDGETTDTETTDTEETDDSENMFEAEMLDEMSLNNHMAKELINIFDNGDNKTQAIIFKLVCGNDNLIKKRVLDLSKGDVLSSGAEIVAKPYSGARVPSGKIYINVLYPNKQDYVTVAWGKSTTVSVVNPDRETFLKDLYEDIDKEEINYIFSRLKEMGLLNSTMKDIDETFENAMILQNPKKNNMFQPGSNDVLDEKDDRCTRIAKRKYDVWPSAYASGAVVKCRQGKIWKSVDENYLEELDGLEEKWSEKYKKSIDCNNPKGFSQKAHCQGKKKHE